MQISYMQNVKKNLKSLMEKQNLTVSDIASTACVKEASVGRWLAGVKAPSAIALYRICQRYGVQMEDMFK